MKILTTELEGVLIIEPQVFGDQRGFFLETYQKRRYGCSGIEAEFVQDNLSFSVRRTLRGLHFQHPNEQAKLVQVLQGEVFDAAVDVRYGSPTFGHCASVILSARNHRQLIIPRGFAHGFCVLSDSALFAYKCDNYYSPEHENGIVWNDPDIAIPWPVKDPILSNRDSQFPFLRQIEPDRLPRYRGLDATSDPGQ
jgi:dTDP-4-dehydrorhamnose 3,5-epimerase